MIVYAIEYAFTPRSCEWGIKDHHQLHCESEMILSHMRLYSAKWTEHKSVVAFYFIFFY